MKRYVSILSDYLDRGVVTILSMTHAVPNQEDISGFYGIQLHDTFASLFFYQECLWMHKGLSEYLLLLQVNQFLIPNITTPLTTTTKPSTKPIYSLIEQSQSASFVKASGEEYYTRVLGSYGHSKYVHHNTHASYRHVKNTPKKHASTQQQGGLQSEKVRKQRRYLRQQDEEDTATAAANNKAGQDSSSNDYDCSIRIDTRSYYGISDSTLLTLFSWGPGDRQWLRGKCNKKHFLLFLL